MTCSRSTPRLYPAHAVPHHARFEHRGHGCGDRRGTADPHQGGQHGHRHHRLRPVAQTLAAKLLELGHGVTISSRDTARDQGPRRAGHGPLRRRVRGGSSGEPARAAAAGSFADAAAHGEVVINATEGGHSLDALGGRRRRPISPARSSSTSPTRSTSPAACRRPCSVCNTDSLGERIQAAFPEARVVKALNTANAQVMVDPGQPPRTDRRCSWPATTRWPRTGSAASCWRTGSAGGRSWTSATSPRRAGMEMWLPLWLRLMGATGRPPSTCAFVTGSSDAVTVPLHPPAGTRRQSKPEETACPR